MKLFTGTSRACSLATHIALEEAGADYEWIPVDMARNAQRSAEYLGVNPKGRVPALVTDRGVLTETPALLVYVAQTHPAAGLLPSDPFEFARLQEANAYLCATVHVAHAHGHRGARWVAADDAHALAAMQAKVPENMFDGLRLFEERYLRGPWVMGEQYTVADPYLFTVARWLERDGVDPTRLPRIVEHRTRVAERPATQRALARYPVSSTP